MAYKFQPVIYSAYDDGSNGTRVETLFETPEAAFSVGKQEAAKQPFEATFVVEVVEVPDHLPEIATNAATISVGSDRYPATLIGNDGKVLIVRHDNDKVVKGSEQDGSAEYEYFANPRGQLSYWRKDGERFVEVTKNRETSRWNKLGSTRRLYVGKRTKYYDPHF